MRKNDALSGSSLHSLTYRRLKDPDNELDKRRQLSFHYSKAAFVEVSEADVSGGWSSTFGPDTASDRDLVHRPWWSRNTRSRWADDDGLDTPALNWLSFSLAGVSIIINLRSSLTFLFFLSANHHIIPLLAERKGKLIKTERIVGERFGGARE